MRILELRTIRRAISERAFHEIDFSLVAPLRHASGFMLGARAFSLFGPDTEEAFGHLGFTNVLGWADPERALSVGLITSGKPMLHPALGDLWLFTRAIGQEAPKVARTGIWFTETGSAASVRLAVCATPPVGRPATTGSGSLECRRGGAGRKRRLRLRSRRRPRGRAAALVLRQQPLSRAASPRRTRWLRIEAMPPTRASSIASEGEPEAGAAERSRSVRRANSRS